MKQPFKLAILGCGTVSKMHLATYQNHHERLEVVAVYDPDPDQAQTVKDIFSVPQAFTSLSEMIREAEWQIAIVCTPTPVHGEAVETLAAAGKQIFMEKPLADSYTEAERIVRLCQQVGVQLAVNQNYRYHYPFFIARDLLQQGKIGKIVNILQQDLIFRQDKGWRITMSRHALSVMGVHWLDGFRYMLDDIPLSITCETSSSEAIDCAGDTDAAIQIRFQKGAMVSYVQSFSSPIKRCETLIIGTEGALVLTHEHVKFYRPGQAEPLEVWDNPYGSTGRPEATFRAMDELLVALETGGEPSNSGRDNLETIHFLEGAYRAADKHQLIDLAEAR